MKIRLTLALILLPALACGTFTGTDPSLSSEAPGKTTPAGQAAEKEPGPPPSGPLGDKLKGLQAPPGPEGGDEDGVEYETLAIEGETEVKVTERREMRAAANRAAQAEAEDNGYTEATKVKMGTPDCGEEICTVPFTAEARRKVN